MINKKFISQLLITAFVAGLVSFIAASPAAEANALRDLLDKYVPGFKPDVPKSTLTAQPTTPYESVDVHEQAIMKAVEEASPSVVSVIVSKDLPIVEQCPYDPFGGLPPEFRQFFGDNGDGFSRPCQKGMQRQEVGGGSGFIISEDGLILTNKHVVSDGKASYTVLTNDGKKHDAKVLARDPLQDLAVVKIDASGLKPLKIGNSDSIQLGQTAIAIGNSLGEFRNTVSVGVISGLSRKIIASGGSGTSELLEDLVQTDAAINPGNSGGPLLNLKGEVIGINTAMASGAQNVGFAIPVNKAKRDISSVKAYGKITVPYLGVRYIAVTEDVAKKENLNIDHGAIIRGNEEGPGVAKNSPASKAGVMAEDIVLEANGVKVDDQHSLASLVQQYQAGEKIRLKILRSGEEKELEVTLEERKF